MTSNPAFWQCPRCKTPNPWASYLTACVSCGEPRPPVQARAVFTPKPEGPGPKPRNRRLAVATYSYAAIVLAALALIRLLGDLWWPATVLLFAPRGVFLVPVAALAIWAGIRKEYRLWATQGATLAVVLGPIMGLCVPVGSLFRSVPEGARVRVLSLNRGQGSLDSKAVVGLVADRRIDVVCIQEPRADPVLDAYFAKTGWSTNRRRSIFTRFPILAEWPETEDPFPEYGFWPVRLSRVRVRLPDGREAIVACAHMPTMNFGFAKLWKGDFAALSRYIDWRRNQAARLLERLRETADLPTILAGDFNMPPDSTIMAMIRRSYVSGFEESGWGFGYTRPSRVPWAGIDRILASRGSRFLGSRVGPQVGSDHLPILGEVVLREPTGIAEPPTVADLPRGPEKAAPALPPRRVLCLGDSITDESVYPEFAAKGMEAAGITGWTFLNAGVGGDTAAMMLDRLDREVSSARPEIVAISAGVNDALHKVPAEQFEKTIRTIVERLKARGVTAILLTPTPIAKDRAADGRLDRLSEAVVRVGKDEGVRVADVRAAFLRAGHDSGATLLRGDGIHPAREGFRLMAKALVESLGAPGLAVPEDLDTQPLPGLIREWRAVAVAGRETAMAAVLPGLAEGRRLRVPEAVPRDEWGQERFRRLGYASHSLVEILGAHPAYQAIATVECDRPKGAVLHIGGALTAVWVNGEAVYREPRWTGWHPDKARVRVKLRDGTNTIAVATDNGFVLTMTDD